MKHFDMNFSFQVIFNAVEILVGIISQGQSDAWVTEYKVEYSDDPMTRVVTWMYIIGDTGWPAPKVTQCVNMSNEFDY